VKAGLIAAQDRGRKRGDALPKSLFIGRFPVHPTVVREVGYHFFNRAVPDL